MTVKVALIWDVIRCGLANGYRRFRGTCCVHLMTTNKKQNAKKNCYTTDMLNVHCFETTTGTFNVVSNCAKKWITKFLIPLVTSTAASHSCHSVH